PSTYVSIMNKIQSRDYTVKESGRLKPTEVGRVIAELLEANFQQIMNIGFTAEMEDNLERVADGEKDWKELLANFWKDFKPTLELAEKGAFVPKVMTDIECPKCASKLQKIWFKSKYFYGCSRYPDCDYSAPVEEIAFNKEDYAEDFDWDQPCPKCGKEMKLRHGRFGAFLGCTTYPECKGIINIPKKGEVAISQEDLPGCPAIDCPGQMTARKSRYGKTFYSCSTFPECDVIVNDLEQLETKYPSHTRTAYVAKPKKGRGKPVSKAAAAKATATSKGKKTTKTTKKAATKEKSTAPKKASNQPVNKLSPDLASIVGAEELSRPMVMKKVWEYIKAHDLQDTKNKRIINPDAYLAKVFGNNEPIDMFKLAGILGKHIG
ncbi:MAG TPA: topoisomerase DNA-binding C4 zinc finger domain-containing protein, partial [Parachlamydiaceae bacterium]|nr:topoisomerase DNA-binding C4 zinc finger domain-containing protein [Parachlamydiaceae bacterium]